MERTQDIQERALAIPEQAKKFEVVDQEGLDSAGEFLVSVKRLRKAVRDTFDPIIDKAHKAHREALSQKKKYDQPLIDGEKIVKRTMAVYVDEQEKLRRIAEEKVRKEQEEIERKKRKEEERALAEAAKAEEEGKQEEVEKILDEAEARVDEPVHTTTVVPQKAQTAPGVSTKMVWKWRIADESKLPREYLVPAPTKIAADLRASQYKRQIPGVVVFQERQMAASGR